MNAYRITLMIALVPLVLLMGCYGVPQTESTMQEPVQSTITPTIETVYESNYSFDLDTDYIEGAQMFDEEEALRHIEYLASDELQGRLVGMPGNQAAGDYIAARFAEYGLQPAGTDSNYFQSFTSTVTINVEQPIFTIITPGVSGSDETSHTYVAHYEYVPRISMYLGSGDATGQGGWLGKRFPS